MRPAKKRPVFLGFFFFSLLVLFSLGIRGPGLTGEAKGPSTDEVAAAVNLYYQGDLEAAIAGYSRLLDRYPSSAEIRLDLIRLLREKGDMPKALNTWLPWLKSTGRNKLPAGTDHHCTWPANPVGPGKLPLYCRKPPKPYWRGLIYKDLRRRQPP